MKQTIKQFWEEAQQAHEAYVGGDYYTLEEAKEILEIDK